MTNAKKDFTRLGLALFALATITIVLQLGLSTLINMTAIGAYALEHEWVSWVATFAPLYLVGVPVSLAIMGKVEKEDAIGESIGVGRFLIYLLMSVGVMYVGNLLGTGLSALLSNGTAQNAVADLAINSGNIKILFMVLAAPVIEELVFRKALIDRCSKYGEKVAIIYSGLTFGLFHMNLFQFFYALGLGLLFAYIYTRTRKIGITILLHMAINALGSLLGPIILSLVDMEVMSKIALGTATAEEIAAASTGIAIYYGYVALLLAVSVAGIILLIVKAKKAVINEAPLQLTKEEAGKTVYGNMGFGLFAAVCLGFMVLTLVAGLL